MSMFLFFSLQSDDTNGCHKEVKRAGLIDAFFHPVKTKQQTKLRFGTEITANSNNDSSQATGSRICVNKAATGVVQEPNVSRSMDKKADHTSKEKTFKLSGKSTLDPASSQEEPVKRKQPKPKWSVTCAGRNSSKYLNSSGSDFEDDGKGAFDAKTEQAQKSGKKKAKNEATATCSGQTGTRESERIILESTAEKDKESEAVCVQKSNTSKAFDKYNEQRTDKSNKESKTLGKSENSQQTRTSAFDVLMKSQRVQKLEDQRTDTFEDVTNPAVTSSDVLENSSSCEIVDFKETVLFKPNVVSQSKLVTTTADSSSDTNKTCSISETNAFDFLMKKGRQQKSPNSMDSQPESEIDSEMLENSDESLKKKSRKKSFEFKLSICASKKKDLEFSLESDYSSSDVVNYEEQAKGNSKNKSRKHKRAGSELVEGGSDESFVNEKCEDVVEVSKSKKGRKKSKVKSKTDQVDISLIEVTPIIEGNRSDKKESKSGKKRVSSTKKITTVADEGGDIEEIDPRCVETTQNKRKKGKQRKGDSENTEKGKNEKIRKPRKRMKSDASSVSPEFLSIEHQETSVWYVHYLCFSETCHPDLTVQKQNDNCVFYCRQS